MRLFWMSLLLFFAQCQGPSEPSAARGTFDTTGYALQPIEGTSASIATRTDSTGQVMEQGLVDNGSQLGAWLYYDKGRPVFPRKIVNYAQGMQNGPYMEFNEQGQLRLTAYYKSGKLHGDWGKYRFARPEVTAQYQDGVLHGLYREFYELDGHLQREVEYKNGKEDGTYRFFDEQGKVTLEYQYKNGEKVSGGMMAQ